MILEIIIQLTVQNNVTLHCSTYGEWGLRSKNRPSKFDGQKRDQRVTGGFEPYFNAGFGVYF